MSENQVTMESRVKKVLLFGVIVETIVLLIASGFGIANILISIEYRDVECAEDGQPPLDMWLFGTGLSVIIASVLLIITSIGLFICLVPSIILGGILRTVVALFEVAWFIVGGVSLFRDSMDCKEEETFFWGWSLAVWCLLGLSIYQRMQRNKQISTQRQEHNF